MTFHLRPIVHLGLACLYFSAAACSSSGGATQDHASKPADNSPTTSHAGNSFTDKHNGVAVDYPAPWRPVENKDYVLMLETGKSGDQSSISLDVPSLPPHLPGMIHASLVRNGYEDDLKKQFESVKVTQDSPAKVGGADEARRLHTTWQQKGTPWTETAMLIVHADRVYILRATAPASDESTTVAAFEKVLASLRWFK